MKFSGKNPCLRIAENRYGQLQTAFYLKVNK